MRLLKLTNDERARLNQGELVFDKEGWEIYVGLDRAESERHITLMRMLRRHRADARDAKELRERHKRALVFWRRALALPEESTNATTAQTAFDLGYAAWNAFAGDRQLVDFEKIIVQVPKDQRLAALNGWLAAFDDEGARLRKG